MTSWKVNADYESVLFAGKSGPDLVTQSLEFLCLYLEDEPLYSSKEYEEDYLQHIQEVTGRAPHVLKTGAFRNWWGKLENIPLERELNSKEFTLKFNSDAFLYTGEEKLDLNSEKLYLAKNPFGMSGQSFLKFKGDDLSSIQRASSKYGKILIEPFFERRFDFSTYVLSTSQHIAYENIVDERFQYKGTLFRDRFNGLRENLSFFHLLGETEWETFLAQRREIISDIQQRLGVKDGYSIDSFVYEEDGKLKIRCLSEINYRKTMGLMTWLLMDKLSGNNKWSALVLGRKKSSSSFKDWKEKLRPVSWDNLSKNGCILLSPGDTRFEMFFLVSNSDEAGKKLFEDVKQLLPDCEFPI